MNTFNLNSETSNLNFPIPQTTPPDPGASVPAPRPPERERVVPSSEPGEGQGPFSTPSRPVPPGRKIRPDAKLKTLSEENQELIIKWIDASPNYRHVIGLIRDRLGVTVSARTLRDFRSWRLLGRPLADLPLLARQLAHYPLPKTDAHRERIAQASALILQLRAVQQHDVNQFCRLRRIQLADHRIHLRRQKLGIGQPRALSVADTLEQERDARRRAANELFAHLKVPAPGQNPQNPQQPTAELTSHEPNLSFPQPERSRP